MRCRFVPILYLMVMAAFFLLSGCARHEVSGTYIAKFTNAIYRLQLVETPDKHLTGQFDTLVLGTDGKVAYNSRSISGAVNGDNISVLLKPISLLPFTMPASGTFNGDEITLTGEFTGKQPDTVAFVRSNAGEYEAQAKTLNEQSQRILIAKADVDVRRKLAQQKRDNVAKLEEFVNRMEHLNATINAQLREPSIEQKYRDITSKMQEYLESQRKLAGDPNASFKRSQISLLLAKGFLLRTKYTLKFSRIKVISLQMQCLS